MFIYYILSKGRSLQLSKSTERIIFRVFTKKGFGAGDFLLIYHGEVTGKNEAKSRKKQYMM